MSGNNSEFHKKVHWRRIREIINKIANHEGINIDEYNTRKIRCYCNTGDEMKGSRVRTNLTNNYSPFVSDNFYEIFEIPKNTNKEGSLSRKLLTSCQK